VDIVWYVIQYCTTLFDILMLYVLCCWFSHWKYNYYTTHHPFNGLFQDNLGKPATERYTIVDFNEARDYGVAVSLAGPYANNLHLAPDR